MKDWITKVLSEKGEPSSKRVGGMLTLIVVLACTIGLTIRDGGTSVVESLLTIEFVSACSLIGLSTITKVFEK